MKVNARLHSASPDPWPPFLVAFASHGCGDYFAYDLRTSPIGVIYIDPDLTVDENLASTDKLRYESFESWHATKISRRKASETETDRHQGSAGAYYEAPPPMAMKVVLVVLILLAVAALSWFGLPKGWDSLRPVSPPPQATPQPTSELANPA